MLAFYILHYFGMSDTEKIDVDSIITRLLEGFFNKDFFFPMFLSNRNLNTHLIILII